MESDANVNIKLIVALSTVDSCFAAVCLVEYSLRKGFNWITWNPFYMTIWPVFILPMQNITYSMSLFVTIAIAIERYYQNVNSLNFACENLKGISISNLVIYMLFI